jgi:hypothetical protein
MDKLDKRIKEVNDIIKPSISHFFVGGELVASEKTTIGLKNYIKQNYDIPSKNIKGYLIRLKINKSDKNQILIMNCMEMTITPKLLIKSLEDDGYQTITYSSNELIKHGFKLSHIKKVIKAIKNNTVSFDDSIISITELLKN